MHEELPMPKRPSKPSYLGRNTLYAVVVSALAPLVGLAQEPVEAVVAKAESSVACVIVSRSDWYRTLDRKLGATRGDEPPGKLGSFDIHSLKTVSAEEQRRLQIKLDLAFPQHVPESFGSGIVIDGKGLILTNYHVVQDATKIYVRLPGHKGSYADIWAADPRSDLAVLKLLDDRVRPLTPIPLGNADNLRRGQPVIALANPFAAGQNDGVPSVSTGVISNLRRRIPGRQPVRETNANPLYQFGIVIQTDARIALGASGGALLNSHGECIGITTSLAAVAGSDAPGGFALPVNSSLRKIIDILKKGEEVDYGFLGIGVKLEPAPGGGAVVDNVQEGSPAEREGHLNQNDVIVAIGPHPVHDNQDLMLALGHYLAGEKAPLNVVRGLTKQKIDVTLVKYLVMGKTIASSTGKRPFVDGVRVDYTSLLMQGLNGRGKIPSGVLVTEVQPKSKAARANLNVFDVIAEVGGVPVTNPAAFYAQFERQKGVVELTLRRDNNNRQTVRLLPD
jgi:serine protease Do